MQPANRAFKTGRRNEWTPERIDRLGTPELRQLLDNAQRLGAAAVVALCEAALAARPRSGVGSRAPRAQAKRARDLTSRSKAFQARGVYLPEAGGSWSAVRKSDGAVVISLWAPAIVSSGGTCRQLLWAPNVAGSRPWSDTDPGKQRLAHCELALERGGGEGLLVYGENFDGEVAEHNARSVHGADAERVIAFTVERRGAEYWAVWGTKAPERAL